MRKLFQLDDPAYDDWIRRYQPQKTIVIWFFFVLHLIPGLFAYLMIYPFRETGMTLLGLDAKYYQLIVLLTMIFFFELLIPFAYLRYKDGLRFTESLRYLGLHRLQPRGLVGLLIITVCFTLVSLPYMKFVHPWLSGLIDALPAFHMGSWHIYVQGYYTFPIALLIVIFVANFLGEEIFFRGFLLKKIGKLKGDWIYASFLFQLYHIWQAPVNWAFVPFAILIPFALLAKLRKGIWESILFHIFTNLVWGELIFVILKS